MNLTYKVVENGYEIYNEGRLWITQYEPYIPNPSLSYEENAKAQIEELLTPPVSIEDEKVTVLETKVASLEEDKLAIQEELANVSYTLMMGGLM